jgi:cation:H+ antiporter
MKALVNISNYLRWKPFITAFVIMSLATASPELFIGISSALRGASELSLGNIIGQNLIHFTVAIFLCAYITRGFIIRNKTTRITAWFSGVVGILPIILILDKSLSRIDGFILILSFIFYILWLFKRHSYHNNHEIPPIPEQNTSSVIMKFEVAMKNFFALFVGAAILILAAQGIVKSAIYFAEMLNIPLFIIGTIIVALGTAMPEVYFSALAGRRHEYELMIGNLLGSTVASTTLVLGITSIISPVASIDLSIYVLSRIFLTLAIVFFTIFIITGRKITVNEGIFLVSLYVIFIAIEIVTKI